MSRVRPCRHCRRTLIIKGRGLCGTCFSRAAVRVLYPPASNGRHDRDDEMTAEQLDALIAERMQCLPSWWASDTRKQAGQYTDHGRRVAGVCRLQLVRRGCR